MIGKTLAMKSRAAVAPGHTTSAAASAFRRVPEIRSILHGLRVQPKLKVGAANDPAEAEADRVADQVMRMPAPKVGPGSRPMVQRLCSECEDEVQTKPVDDTVRRMKHDDEDEPQMKPAPDTVQRIEAELESDFPCIKSFFGGEVLFSALPQVVLDDIVVINEPDDGGLTSPAVNDVWYDCDGFWYRPESQWFKIPGHCAVTVTDLTPSRLVGLRCCNIATSVAIEGPRWTSDGLDDSKRNPFLDNGDKETVNRRAPATSAGAAFEPSVDSANKIRGLGGGSPLPASERAFFEPRFGHSFENVRVHDGPAADAATKSINARAFTLGHDIAFAGTEYRPGDAACRTLLAHELTHVVQQKGSTSSLQRAWGADTGWRYTPPATVTRSIEEIQAVVGVTPDGVYGPNTRDAVRRYQAQLASQGLYSGTQDGKWGNDTELGHVAYATGNETETYNCSGLAFKTYTHIGMTDTETVLGGMTQLSSCSDNCGPRQYKFWHWAYDVSLTDLATGVTGPSHRDFHIVGGQTDGTGNGPSVVVSKNGSRPVQGPAAPTSWRPVTEPARVNDHTNAVVPGVQKNRTGHVERCFCAASLP